MWSRSFDGSTGDFTSNRKSPARRAISIRSARSRSSTPMSPALARIAGKALCPRPRSVLLIFQGMDAAGKDSAVEHVMSGINPQGCQVFSFKQPTSKELSICGGVRPDLPERRRGSTSSTGCAEELLIVRVHPEILAQEKIPPEPVTNKEIWQERFEDISAFERLHGAQRNPDPEVLPRPVEGRTAQPFARLDDPAKNWKFSMGDIAGRSPESWTEYQAAYRDVIRHTSANAPWHVVPADQVDSRGWSSVPPLSAPWKKLDLPRST